LANRKIKNKNRDKAPASRRGWDVAAGSDAVEHQAVI